jgi:uncharacterized protein (DUF1800 family)
MSTHAAVIAANRFGLGARPGDLDFVAADPRGWLRAQLTPGTPSPAAIAALPGSASLIGTWTDAASERRMRRPEEGEFAQRLGAGIRKSMVPAYLDQVAARIATAVRTEAPFRERLVQFWSNHFTVSIDKPATIALAGTLENEAIRPNLVAPFRVLLRAVEQHPAMILYLDNQRSIGANSRAATRGRRWRKAGAGPGLNENLAREILELHTLGVDGGYAQADVTAFARVLTGWSVGGGPGPYAQGEVGRFLFRERTHEPGAQRIRGRVYGQSGVAQGLAALDDLARDPVTARYLATKLLRHFITDEPSAAMVERLVRFYLRHDGDLGVVYAALVDAPEGWAPERRKYKTPNDYLLSGMRALDLVPRDGQAVVTMFDTLGQRVWAPGSPAGWPDVASAWDGADALMKRIEWALAIGERLGADVDARRLAPAILGPLLTTTTSLALQRAETGAQALALLLSSPEFLYR